ncbi:MAG: excinuclease ABC subunit UvrB [Mycoplasmatales bacterium]
MKFKLNSEYQPSGDQPEAIKKIVNNINKQEKNQVLLGATGTGKTFTMANVIEQVNMPTVVLAHNKTLASQLYGELKSFFPNNRVEYFVSYFDYYQPEAYIPGSDTYIEKDSKINEEIDRMRHSATSSLFEGDDVIIVSSVSCIYALGNPSDYRDLRISLRLGEEFGQKNFIYKLIDLQYERNDVDFKRGSFRVRGDVVDVIAAHNDKIGYRVEFFGDEIDGIIEFDVLTGKKIKSLKHQMIFPASHYISDPEYIKEITTQIEKDMEEEVLKFKQENKLLEAQRLEQRTKYDLEMLREIGFCSGIENYTRYFSGNTPGATPYTLLDFLPDDFLMIIDESHATLPQVRGMFNGDRARKQNLVNYGFRVQAALDNRPLRFEEFINKLSYTVYVSATPADYEKEVSHNLITEQIIRPTGLVDPLIEIRPKENQIDNIIQEIKSLDQGNKMLITTLTKKIAEDLTDYLENQNIKVAYLHSDIKTFERIQIINQLRAGKFDVLIGINLLREGLDIPEVTRVLILDADKEGFLRSETSLIQTIGRAARNSEGKVIFFADKITNSMQKAIDETSRRREKQVNYNKLHNIVPTTVKKDIADIETTINVLSSPSTVKKEKAELIKELTNEMEQASKDLNFEQAAKIRDILLELKGK